RSAVTPGHGAQPLDVQLPPDVDAALVGNLGLQVAQLLVRQVSGTGRGVERGGDGAVPGLGGHGVSSELEATGRAAFFACFLGVGGTSSGSDGFAGASRALSLRNVS